MKSDPSVYIYFDPKKRMIHLVRCSQYVLANGVSGFVTRGAMPEAHTFEDFLNHGMRSLQDCFNYNLNTVIHENDVCNGDYHLAAKALTRKVGTRYADWMLTLHTAPAGFNLSKNDRNIHMPASISAREFLIRLDDELSLIPTVESWLCGRESAV